MRSSILLANHEDILLLDPDECKFLESLYGSKVIHAHKLYLNRNHDYYYNSFIQITASLHRRYQSCQSTGDISLVFSQAYKADEMLPCVRSHYVELAMALHALMDIKNDHQAYADKLLCIKSELIQEIEKIESYISEYFLLRLNILTEELALNDGVLSEDHIFPLQWLNQFVVEAILPYRENNKKNIEGFIANIFQSYSSKQEYKIKRYFRNSLQFKEQKQRAYNILTAEKIIFKHYMNNKPCHDSIHNLSLRYLSKLYVLEETLLLGENYASKLELIH